MFVLGEMEGMELIESLDGVEGLIITSDKRILRSRGFGAFEEFGEFGQSERINVG